MAKKKKGLKLTPVQKYMLNSYMSKYEGAGIFEKGKELVGKVVTAVKKKASDILLALTGFRNKASPKVRKFIEENGDAKVINVTISRKPIISAIDKLSNIITLGKWNENKKKLAYDNLFHLFQTITLDNGKKFKMEKNEVIIIIPPTAPTKDESQMEAGNPNVSFAQYMLNAEKKAGGVEQFFRYDPITANCQVFTKNCLQGNGLWTASLERFVMQDATKLIEGMPWYHKLAQSVTDLAHKINIVIEGEGKKKRKRRKISKL